MTLEQTYYCLFNVQHLSRRPISYFMALKLKCHYFTRLMIYSVLQKPKDPPHTRGKFCIQARSFKILEDMDFQFVFNLKMNTKTFNFGGKSTFQILPLFIKNKNSCSIRTRDLGLVVRRYIRYATEKVIKLWRYKLFLNALKSPICDVLS